MRYLYGVFAGTAWAMYTNKRIAFRAAKSLQGTVRSMPWPSSNSWDAPTFRVLSDQIADFRR